MNVLVLGAAGKSGRLVVDRALAAGHAVNALVHSREELEKHPLPDAVSVTTGDVQNPTTLRAAIEGCHAVIETIGSSKPFLDTTLEATAAKVLLEVMQQTGVRRLIVISVLGAGDSKDQAGFLYEHLLMPIYLRGTMKDKNQMEQEVANSGLDWTLVRPPVLTDSKATGTVRIVADGETANHITRADLAQFLVDQLTSSEFVHQAITVESH